MMVIIRLFFLTGLAAMVLLAGAVAVLAQPVQFFENLQDIPLMPGLTERMEDALLYDKADGRVVESVADMSDFSREAVRDYYQDVLPQFGWQYRGVNRFSRGGESLELAFERHGESYFVRFLVQPR